MISLPLTNYLLSKYRSTDHLRPGLCGTIPVRYQDTDWLAATDASQVILIRKNSENHIDPPEAKTPDVAAILPKMWTAIEVPSLLISSVYDSVPVTEENEQQECESCDGNGEFQHYGDTYNCKNCHEKGSVDTGNIIKVRGHNTLIHIDGLKLDFKLFDNMCEVIKQIQPQKITFLRQQDNKILSCWILDDQVIIAMACKSEGFDEEDKHVVLPIEVVTN
jgi:hypothetical protein